MTKISDERLAEMLAEVEDLQREALNDADADQNPMLAVDAVGEFALSEMRSIITELQSLRAQGGVRVEEDGGTERHIDELRLRAFNTNAVADMLTYFSACSKWFQDRHFRRMALASLEASPAPVSEEMVDRACQVQHVGWRLWKEPQKRTAREVMHAALTTALAAKGGQ